MAELDGFEARVAAAVRAMAGRADTDVDAVAVAERAAGTRRRPVFVGLGREVPVHASILLVAALLLALLLWTVQVGGPWDHRTTLLPPIDPTPTATLEASASPDGKGDEHVTGGGSFTILDEGTSVVVDGVTQLRGFVAASQTTMDDPRVSGTGRLELSVDRSTAVGREWGTYRLEGPDGAWEGTVSGASWNAGNESDTTGWLIGSGAYEGYTYFIHTTSSGFSTQVEGIIFPGAPPEP